MTDDNDTLTAKQARALAAADVEMRRLHTALEAERRITDAARVYILYTEAAYPGDENQIELLTKWLEACKRRGEG